MSDELVNELLAKGQRRNRRNRGRHYVVIDSSDPRLEELWGSVRELAQQFGVSANTAGLVALAKGVQALSTEK